MSPESDSNTQQSDHETGTLVTAPLEILEGFANFVVICSLIYYVNVFKCKKYCPEWGSNPQPLDLKIDALSIAPQGPCRCFVIIHSFLTYLITLWWKHCIQFWQQSFMACNVLR